MRAKQARGIVSLLTNGEPAGHRRASHLARHWHTSPYSTNSTGYYFWNLPAEFKTAVRDAEAEWEAIWGGGPQYFHYYENSWGTPISQYDHTIAMAVLPRGYLGMVYFEPWYFHTMTYFGAPFYRTVHNIDNWCIRLQSDMSWSVMDWDDGNQDFIADRESVAAHEMGHIICLVGDGTIEVAEDWQTMLHLGAVFPEPVIKTGTWMRTPAYYDALGVTNLYPRY